MAVLRNGSKCSHTTCMLRFFTDSRLTLNPNLISEIGSSVNQGRMGHILFLFNKIPLSANSFYFLALHSNP